MIKNPNVLKWKKRGAGYLPPLPNTDSPYTTATTKLIDLNYSNKRIAERWTWERYQRLCSFLKLTEPELASLCLMPHAWLEKFRDYNRIPCSVSGGGRAVAMILTMLEARVMKKVVADVIVNPFPILSTVLRQGAAFSRPLDQAASVHGQKSVQEGETRLTG